MNPPFIVLEGLVSNEGALEVRAKVPWPGGRVRITVVPLPELPVDDPFWQRMQAIWQGQRARGHLPRTTEEVESDRRAVREEWEERMGQIEHFQAEASRLRQARSPKP
jgi:hypothetical protein